MPLPGLGRQASISGDPLRPTDSRPPKATLSWTLHGKPRSVVPGSCTLRPKKRDASNSGWDHSTRSIQRKTPFDSGQVQSRRITLIWCHGERMLRNDDWRTMTESLVSGGDSWVGYTFFQPGTASGALLSRSSSSAHKERGSGLRQ